MAEHAQRARRARSLGKRLEIVRVGVVLNIKEQLRSPLELVSASVVPIIYATLAIYLFRRSGQPEDLLYASLAAGLMSMFSTVLFGAGNSIQFQRHQGVLEHVVIAPTSLIYPLLGSSLATSMVGALSVVATLAWGAILFGIPVVIASPVAFAVSLAVMLLSLSSFGLALSAAFISLRNANAIFNTLDYPAWMLSGMLISITTLPTPAQWLSKTLPSRWGVDALSASLSGDSATTAILWCLCLGAAYLALAIVGVQFMERRARRRGALALA